MNQSEKVLDFMRKNNGITIYDSTYKLGITRLSARIWDLKDAGFEIDEK
jgi:hypothetical protein